MADFRHITWRDSPRSCCRPCSTLTHALAGCEGCGRRGFDSAQMPVYQSKMGKVCRSSIPQPCVHKKVSPDESQGWTVVLMDRATRFIWDMHCGRKDRKMFKKAMGLLCQVIQQTGDLTLLTDGERRYGSLLFELCSEALRNGQRGRPKKTLPKGVKVRIKNKGSQRHKRGPKRPKYQAPYPEHPDTAQPLATTEIHANHLEAFHTSLRRRCAAYRRRTNMYAKKTGRLQERLDVYWIVQ